MDKNLGWLMVDNARLLRRAFDERVRAIGITGPQARLLLALERSPGENQAFHAELLEVEPITLCRMVDRMEESGLVERRNDPRDRRARLLYLTPRAAGEAERIRAALAGMLDQMLDGLDENEQAAFSRMLHRVSGNLSTTPAAQEPVHG
jgi:DNA-binding MarR family transcriptional regulator|tara:strand:+ start:3643 stop:4089 length:447 start_codon:yes stop_codon:yes gene_type:complete